MHIVVQFRAVRSLDITPPLGRGMVGGVRGLARKICRRPHFPFQASEINCCDSVAMRAVSSRCRLKSLQDERSREPLSHRNCRGWTDRPRATSEDSAKRVADRAPADRAPPRCDARGFTPPPIEIIARQKVAQAFEPQRDRRAGGPNAKRGHDTGPERGPSLHVQGSVWRSCGSSLTLGTHAPDDRMEGFDPELPYKLGHVNGREARESGLRLKPLGCARTDLCGSDAIRLIDPLPTLPVSLGAGAGSQKAARTRCGHNAQRLTFREPVEIAVSPAGVPSLCRLRSPATRPVQARRKSTQYCNPEVAI
jgi:hypothetical protein